LRMGADDLQTELVRDRAGDYDCAKKFFEWREEVGVCDCAGAAVLHGLEFGGGEAELQSGVRHEEFEELDGCCGEFGLWR
jgi:hypothetical protein